MMSQPKRMYLATQGSKDGTTNYGEIVRLRGLVPLAIAAIFLPLVGDFDW